MGDAYVAGDIYAGGSKVITEVSGGNYPVKDYGAKGDCVTDDGPAIQAAINAAAAAGGGRVVLTPACYILATPLIINTSHVLLSAPGTSMWTGANAPQTSGVRLKWTGVSGASMLTVTAIAGPSNQQILGVDVTGISFLCNSRASVAVDVYSQWQGTYSVYAEACTTALMRLQTVPQLQKHVDTQELHIYLYGDQSSNSGYGLYMQGNVTALPVDGNPSLNTIHVLDILYANGTALWMGNADHNQFHVVRGLFTSLSSTGNLVTFAANAVTGQGARNNVIYMQTGHGQVIAQGTETAPGASTGNRVMWIDFEDSPPLPSIGTGATLFWGNDAGVSGLDAFFSLGIGDSYGVARNALNHKGTQSLYIANGASNHITLVASDGVSFPWSMNLDSVGNFRIYNSPNISSVLLISNPVSESALLLAPNSVAAAEVALLGTTSLRIYNSANDHIKLTDGTHTYGFNIDTSSGNLRTTTITGSNLWNVNPTIQGNNNLEIAGWACTGCSAAPPHTTIGDDNALRFFQGSGAGALQVIDTITITGGTAVKTNNAVAITIPSAPAYPTLTYSGTDCSGGLAFHSLSGTGPSWRFSFQVNSGACPGANLNVVKFSQSGCSVAVSCMLTDGGSGISFGSTGTSPPIWSWIEGNLAIANLMTFPPSSATNPIVEMICYCRN